MDIVARLIFVCLALLPSLSFGIGSTPVQLVELWACSGRLGLKESSSAFGACSAAYAGVGESGEGTGFRTVTVYKVLSCGPEGGSETVFRCVVEREETRTLISSGDVVSRETYSGHLLAGKRAPEYKCGPGATQTGTGSTSVCACNSGFAPDPATNQCKQYACPPSGGYSAVTQPDQKVANAGDIICSGGCGQQPSSWKVGEDGQIWATWPFKSTGRFCGGDASASEPSVSTGEQNSQNPAPVACGTNQCPGNVNGAAVCVPCKKQVEEGPSTSASAPGGSASSPGAGSSSTSVECNGVNCTTTTVTRDGAGNVVGSAQKTEKQESFCKENPESSLCKKSSFGGTCGTTTCEGDAIQCAIAADQYRRHCQWFDDSAAAQLADVGNAAITGQARPDGHPANAPDAQSVAFSSSIDMTDRLGGGCPSDVAVNVAGRSVAIPFSSMCGNLQLVGGLMVGFCMFVAVLIVFRG
jgi:hypothetical protein